ncbi:transporter [Lignipirellula cremea]|uniref:MetA-pathway of phenol degradation n=1 Tax=Lignipirellula cremea TaxID=2528010 RepID=A0A518E2V6_9BACT|nr:transporter [Lignipirellula cremea]QDU98426.1 hypothetical protein Pla8534_62940 [Lignipirellula cremea]
MKISFAVVLLLLLGLASSLSADEGISPAEPPHASPGYLLHDSEYLQPLDPVPQASFDACAEYWKKRRGFADKHAPAGIMGDHMHKAGEFMVEYKYMNMYMDGNRVGTQRVSDQQALTIGQSLGTNFGATPTAMTMEMHMIHLMYGWSDDVTLYTMINLPSITMDHLRNTPFPPNPPLAGTRFTTHNSGLGDTVFGALVRGYQDNQNDLIFNLAFSAPTGDLDRLTTVPTGGGAPQEFPYPMRLGSGTFNFRPGVTYKHYMEKGSLGMQFQTDLPLGRNYDGYSVSDEFRLNNWYSHLVTDRFALSFRVENLWKSNFSGFDRDVATTNPRVISTNRPDMRGGYWLNFGYGAMLLVGNGHLLNFEIVQPIYQDLDGIQLEADFMLAASWSKAF